MGDYNVCKHIIMGSHTSYPADTRHWAIVGSMLGQRRRRWTNIKQAMVERLVFAE